MFGIRSQRNIEDFRGSLPDAIDQCANAVLADAKSGTGIGRERTYQWFARCLEFVLHGRGQ